MGLEGGWEESRPPFVRSFSRTICVALTRTLWGLDVKGLELVPRGGAVIVAFNHVANLDGFLAAMAASPVRCLRFLGKAELFRWPLLGWYLRQCGCIPVDRARADVGALRAAEDVLRRGWSLGLAPEGTRVRPGQPPRKPKAGVGFLAGRTGAAVVPARLLGTDRWPLPGRLEVRFGAPMRFLGDVSDHQQCETFARRVMDVIFSL